MAFVLSPYCKPAIPLCKFHSLYGNLWNRENVRSSSRKREFTVTAMFWRSNKSPQVREFDVSLRSYTLIEPGIEEAASVNVISLSVVSSISEITQSQWDACAFDSSKPDTYNPFLTHGFLSSLEHTSCAVRETGWMPFHVVAKDGSDNVLGVAPLYLKSHSYGEFVFDHSWADAYRSFGGRYYPKLQCCVPFTPVTGPRILIRGDSPCKDQVFDAIVSAMTELAAKLQVSSLHITFPSGAEWTKLKEKGFSQRIGMQYHWKNRDYKDFDEFLMDMKQSKRKNIRQERKKIVTQNLKMRRLQGDEIKARHWDSFYDFYKNTTDNKWGTPYLTREFFHEMASNLGDNVLLVLAEENEEPVAGALNLIGGDTLFGRLWGCRPESYYPSLHFEACYYQAIEAAIELKLKTVEAGAQGEHKIQRGYLPVKTYSCHYIFEPGFRQAIDEFLVRESDQVDYVIKVLHESGPFKETT
ncbi:unnamed protein product [Cochlearia groenlandica]